MKRRRRRHSKTVGEKQIVRQDKEGRQGIGLDENVRVVYSEENNPHDG